MQVCGKARFSLHIKIEFDFSDKMWYLDALLDQYRLIAPQVDDLHFTLLPTQYGAVPGMESCRKLSNFKQLRTLSLPYQTFRMLENDPGDSIAVPSTLLPSTLEEFDLHYPQEETSEFLEKLVVANGSEYLAQLRAVNVFTHPDVLDGSADFVAGLNQGETSIFAQLQDVGLEVTLRHGLH